MSLTQSLRTLLKPNDVPTVITDADLVPQGFNDAARQFLPGLCKGLPLPDQFPDTQWREAILQLALMRPCRLSLDGSPRGQFSVTLVPIFQGEGLAGVLCCLSDTAPVPQDPSLAMALHDLSTPLATLRNCAQLIKARLPLRDVKLVEILEQNLLDIRRTVSSIAATLDTGGTSTAAELVNLREVVEHVCKNLISDPDAPSIVCDRIQDAVVLGSAAQLQRALLNLVANGLRHAKSQVLVSVVVRDGSGVMEVADDGPGVPPEDLPHILTPWFSTGRRGGGLGLSVADLFARQNSGRLDVENRGGAVFTITLPLSSGFELSAVGRPTFWLSDEIVRHELELALFQRKERLQGSGNGENGPL